MIFIDTQDFFVKANRAVRPSRDLEKEYAIQARAGNQEAKDRLVEGYMPIIASYVKRLGKEMQSLELIYRMVNMLEREVEAFDFLQDGEAFTHRLSLRCKKIVTEYIADR